MRQYQSTDPEQALTGLNSHVANQPLPEPEWDSVLPFLDVWLHVSENEVHYVQKILPTLDWDGGRLGVRMRLEPKDAGLLQQEYVTARAQALTLQVAGAHRVYCRPMGECEVVEAKT